jgi:hypothetical protein
MSDLIKSGDISAEQLDGLSKYAGTGVPHWFGELFKFNGKTGVYTAGFPSREIEKGRILVAVVPQMRAGHVLWRDGELIDESWLPASQLTTRARAPLRDQDEFVKTGPRSLIHGMKTACGPW